MILRTTKAQQIGVRWASRIALAVGILACGGSSEDSVFGTRDSALEEGAADAANAPQAGTSSGVLGVATEDGPDEEAGATGNDSGAASGSCVVSDGDDSDGDDDDGVESDGDDVDDGVDSDGDNDVEDVEEVEDGVESDGDDVDSDGDDVESDGDDVESDGDDVDSDGDDSGSDDCVPAPVAPEAAPVEIQ